MKNQIVIGIKDLRIFCKIGLLKEEKQQSQNLLIDLEVYCHLPKEKLTKIRQTVDYVFLKEVCESLVKKKQYDLLETYAQDIEKKVRQLKGVKGLKICIKKPGAFANAKYGYVTIQRFFE